MKTPGCSSWQGAFDFSPPDSSQVMWLLLPHHHNIQPSVFILLKVYLTNKTTQHLCWLFPPVLFSSSGLNSLNFLLSAGQPAAGVALPPSSVPTLALPYVLLPSAALSHYPLVASGLQQPGSDTKVSFSLPTVMSAAHFMVGGAPYGLAAEISRSPVTSPSTPEQSRLYVSSAAGTPHSPSRPRHTVSITTTEPLVGI